MKRHIASTLVVVALVGFVGSAFGCPKECGSKKNVKLTADESVKVVKASDGKAVDAVIASLPKMQYRVGSETTCCSMTAKMMAKKSGKAMEFVVGDDAFADRNKAAVKLVSLLEKELESMQAMQFAVGSDCVRCPMTAKRIAKKQNSKVAYRVGGVDFQDKVQAEEAVKLASAAAGDVKMSYKVADKSFCCDKMAGAHVKKTGKKMRFVVGDDEVEGADDAKIALVSAKIRRVVEAVSSVSS